MRRFFTVALLCAACSRDLSVPPPPGPGTVYGRVVVSAAGSGDKVPAPGAQVTLVASSVSVAANESGNFVLEGITQTRGQLLFRYDINGDGSFARQKVLKLEAIGA